MCRECDRALGPDSGSTEHPRQMQRAFHTTATATRRSRAMAARLGMAMNLGAAFGKVIRRGAMRLISPSGREFSAT